ncbi:MAG: PAS domain-containing protein [Bacteriovoracaceae bacterium]|nr:PAS domain-containing protein [Bacteriovoracaceae bacterium]
MVSEKHPILILDNPSSAGGAWQTCLQQWGLSTKLICTGPEVEKYLAAHRPRLVLLDHQLPDMPTAPLIIRPNMPPFIVLSSQGDEAQAAFAMKAGALDYLILDDDWKAQLAKALSRALRRLKTKQHLSEMEQSLWETERRYQNLINHLSEGLIGVDLQENIIFTNPAANEIFAESNSCLGHNLAEYTDETTFARIEAETQLRQQGIESDYEISIVNKKHEAKTLLLSCVPQVNKAEEVIGSFGIIRDITEQKAAEQKLQEQDRLLLALSLAMHDLISNRNFDQAINSVLRRMGEVLHADRVFVLEKTHNLEKRQEVLNLCYEWAAFKVSPRIDDPLLQNIDYQKYFAAWASKLAADQIINGPTKKLLDSRGGMQNIKVQASSLCLIPILLEGQVWGILGITQNQQEKYWAEHELSILKTAASSIGPAIVRQKYHQALELNEWRLDALLKLNQSDWQTSPDDLSAHALEDAVRLTRSRAGQIAFVENGKIVRYLQWPSNFRFGLAHPEELLRETITAKRPIMLNEYRATSTPKKLAVRRFLSTPIFSGDQLVAVASAINKFEEYDENDARQLALLMQGMWQIMERRHAAEEMRALNQFNEEIISCAAEGIWVIDREKKFQLINKKMLELFDLPEDHFLETPYQGIPEIQPFIQEHRFDDFYQQALQGKIVTAPDMLLSLPHQAKKIWISSTYSPHRDAHGQIIGVIGMARDITERKNAELALIRSDRLAVVGTLAAGVAHEFNNINTTILGMLQLTLMKEPSLTERGRERLEITVENIGRATAIIRNLQNLARPQQVQKQRTEIDSIVLKTINLIQENFARQGIEVELNLHQPPAILLDPGQIGQVLLNLLINASHALVAAEKKKIIISSYQKEHHVYLTVEDFGHGIKTEILDKIFDPFFSTKGEHSEGGQGQAQIKGTGLGLSISQIIMRDHGGDILVETHLGKGTKMILQFPAAD